MQWEACVLCAIRQWQTRSGHAVDAAVDFAHGIPSGLCAPFTAFASIQVIDSARIARLRGGTYHWIETTTWTCYGVVRIYIPGVMRYINKERVSVSVHLHYSFPLHFIHANGGGERVPPHR